MKTKELTYLSFLSKDNFTSLELKKIFEHRIKQIEIMKLSPAFTHAIVSELNDYISSIEIREKLKR